MSHKMIANAISGVGVPLTSFEITLPSAYLAELFSNRDLSITVAGGNVTKPLTEVRALVTASQGAFDEFFAKYFGGLPVFDTLARRMEADQRVSTPAMLGIGEWYLPYVDYHTVEDACLIALEDGPKLGLSAEQLDFAATSIAAKISVVRCHRATMLEPAVGASQPARRFFYNQVLAEYNQLVDRWPLSSAFEHQAQPDYLREPPHNTGWANPDFHGNFVGWQQHRMLFVQQPPITHTHNQALAATQQETAING